MRTILLAFAVLIPLAPAQRRLQPAGLVSHRHRQHIAGNSERQFREKTESHLSGRKWARAIGRNGGHGRGIHQLSVINWPDVWVVNLLDKTGEHIVDDSPKSDVHITALGLEPSDGLPPAWAALEFGCEWEFFAANKATQVPTEKHDMIKHQITDGAWRVTLITARDSQAPWALMLSKDNNVVYAIRYLSYEHRAEVDPALFAKPEGIKFKDPLK